MIHLTELLKFKKDMTYTRSGTFGFEAFMLTLLPSLIAWAHCSASGMSLILAHYHSLELVALDMQLDPIFTRQRHT